MKRPRPTIGQIAARRRGILAISLAVAMMLIIFGTLLGLTQSLAAGYLRTENAWAAAQALYAAEAGLDFALQTGSSRPVVGRCGRARYAVQRSGTQITALGQVELASGTLIRRAVTGRVRAGGGIITGTWRLVPPAAQDHLISLLHAEGEGGDQ